MLAGLLAACGGSLPPSAMPRPVGEDLLALVPPGAELILDVDVQQLRGWEQIERVLGLLPPAGRARLDRLGPHWLGDIDALVVAGWRGPSGPESTLVLRGDLDDEKLPALLEAEGTKSELHGNLLVEAAGTAALRIAPRLVVVGSPIEVRRVSEIARGESQGMRDASGDAALRQALTHAPSAKRGRPALLGAAIGGPLLTERLEDAGFSGRKPEWASFALAVGDGVDAVFVLGMATPAEAATLRTDLDRSLRDLRSRPIVRLLRLQDAFDFVSLARDRELRIAYRLSGERLDGFLARMDEGKRALEALKGRAAPPVEPPKK